MHLFGAVLVAAMLFQQSLVDLVNSSPTLQTAATVFTGVFVQATPFLVLGVLISGAIAAFVSPRVLRAVLPKRESVAVGVAGLAGAALPGCEMWGSAGCAATDGSGGTERGGGHVPSVRSGDQPGCSGLHRRRLSG